MKPVLYAFLGAVTGTLAAVCILHVRLDDLPGFWRSSEFDLFPGVIFGLVFGSVFWAEGRLKPIGVIAFVLAATISNALAVIAGDAVDRPVAALLGAEDTSDLVFGLSGMIAGALGGGLLGYTSERLLRVSGWWRLMAAGGALGPLLLFGLRSHSGLYAFYIVWQAGYAATMATMGARKK